MKPWSERAVELHHELANVAEVGRFDPRWWLVSAGAAVVEPWPARGAYLISDAEPGADTFMGYVAPAPIGSTGVPSLIGSTGLIDPIADAIARAHAARVAIRELDGTLPDQLLAVTVARTSDGGATKQPCSLDRVAFVIGERVVIAPLAHSIADEGALAVLLARELDESGLLPHAREGDGEPFVTISLGEDPIALARHAHRRGWTKGGGPWLGLGRASSSNQRAESLATVSTCHMVVDGYGHAQLVRAIADAYRDLADRAPTAPHRRGVPPLPTIPDMPAPLGIAWRTLDDRTNPVSQRSADRADETGRLARPRAVALAYELGRVLHHRAGRPDARFSPTFQIPVAPGRSDDPERRRRRVVYAVSSVRFTDGVAEPYEAFAARTRDILAREAAGEGLCARMLAAARAMPAPLAWKRRQFSATRPRWLDRISDVLGGRACLSRMTLDGSPGPALCAVSSPSRLATRGDPLGACVVTVIDHPDGAASITACGSGLAGTPADAEALLDELLH